MEFAFDWWAVIIALLFVVFDFVTGLIKSIKNKNISSQKLREGLFHKVSFVLVILLAIICEAAMTHIDMSLNVPLVAPVCGYIVITEIASAIENIAEINPELQGSPIFKLFANVKDEK